MAQKEQQIRKKYDKEKDQKQQQQQERLNYMFLGLILFYSVSLDSFA